jgi:hypothetical protein
MSSPNQKLLGILSLIERFRVRLLIDHSGEWRHTRRS